MNNFYSPDETYYPRWLTTVLRETIDTYPVVVLTGARQVGKSTLLRNATPFSAWQYQSMDSFDVLEQAERDAPALWAGVDRVVLDEVQRVPRLLLAVKQTVDQAPGRVRFVLSGSANLLLMRQISESLAGRAIYLVLAPMTRGEMQRTSPPQVLREILAGNWPEDAVLPEPMPDPIPFMLRGLLPTLLRYPEPTTWPRWWDGYVTTYLERDLRQLSQVDNLVDFRRGMALLALRTGQVLNQSDIARDAGLSQSTMHRYINLMEATHLFERLPPFTASHTTRLVKSPKACWNDPGLAIFLSGYFTEEELRSAREYGAFFETLIYHHLRVLASLMSPPGRLHYWRTRTGAEVDFVLVHGRKLLAIEVKSTERPRYDDCHGLSQFLAATPDAVGGVLLHTGSEVRRMGEKIIALPWTAVTG